MKRFPITTPSTTPPVPQQAPAAASPSGPGQSSFDIQLLLDKSGTILAREIQNMLIASSGGKLDGASSRDLVAYIKLLVDLKTAQAKELADLSPEELQALGNSHD